MVVSCSILTELEIIYLINILSYKNLLKLIHAFNFFWLVKTLKLFIANVTIPILKYVPIIFATFLNVSIIHQFTTTV